MHSRLGLSFLLAAACSPAATPPPIGQTTPTATATATKPAGPDSPARWALEPAAAWRPTATVAVEGGTLEVGPGGERWLKTATDRKAAATLMAGDVVGATRDGAGLLYVTRDGTVYASNDPLGAVSKVGSAPGVIIAAAIGKSAILVVDGTGALSRSTDRGKTYAKVSLPPPADGAIVDIVMSGPVGLALAFPQRVLATRDDGANWGAVASPDGGGDRKLELEGGELVLLGKGTVRYAFNPGAMTFSVAPAVSTKPRPGNRDEDVEEVIRVVEGKRGLSVRGQPYSQKREWSLAVGELGATPAPRVVDELTGCDGVSAAMRGDVVELACDGRGTTEGGIDKTSVPFSQYGRWNMGRRPNKTPAPVAADGGAPSTGMITKLLRSEDGGKSFKDDGSLDGGGGPRKGQDGLALGSEGWLFVAPRCDGPSWQQACRRGKVRAGATASFVDPPWEAATTFVRFATNAKQSDVFAIGTDDGASVYRFKAGATDAEKLVNLASSADPESATLTLEDDGSVRGFVHASDGPHAFEVKAASTDLTSIDVPTSNTTRVAFGGGNAVAWASGKTYESSDHGKTWSLVTWPTGASGIEACSAWGCATGRGFRSGWDGANVQAAAPEPPVKYVAAKPLKCTAQGGRWSKLGGGGLASIEDVDVGNARWLLPTREADGRVTLHVNKRGDSITKTSDVVLAGPQLGPPTWGAETVMHVQPTGVIVRRYTYSKHKTAGEFGRYNPVDGAVTWYRADTGKVFRASVPKIPAFRVNHDPKYDYEGPLSAYPNPPEVLVLDPKGVYFATASYEDADDKPLFLLHDDGRTDKLKAKQIEGEQGVLVNVQGDTAIVSSDGDYVDAHWLQRDKTIDWFVSGHGAHISGSASVFDFGGRPALAQTAEALETPRAWAVPIRPDNDPGEWFSLATQKSLGDVPRACDTPPPTDGSAFRYFAPYSNGTRHAVTVDVDGNPVLLATDRGAIRGSSKAPSDACMSAMEATYEGDEGDVDYSALLFPDDLAHSLVFMVNKADPWPETVSVRPMECAYTTGAIPEDLQKKPGFHIGTLPAQTKPAYRPEPAFTGRLPVPIPPPPPPPPSPPIFKK